MAKFMYTRMNSFSTQLINTKITITTTISDILDRIVALYPTTPAWWTMPATSAGTIHIDRLQSDRTSGEQYAISVELGCFNHLSHCTSLTALISRTNWYINHLPLYALPEEKYAIHAAAVSSGRGAILLPGNTGTGKSTLTAALVFSGYTYLSDEIAVINCPSGRVWPFPKPISLRKRGAEALGKEFPDWLFNLDDDLQLTPEGLLLSPRRWLPASCKRGFIVSHVVFPLYQEQCTVSELVPMHRSMALLQLMHQQIGVRQMIVSSTNIKSMVKLIQQSECYALRVGTLRSAVACIDRLLAGDQPGPTPTQTDLLAAQLTREGM